MQQHNEHVNEFLQSVCREIRFKSIHKTIVRELSDHIEDQKNEYMKEGLDEGTAVLKAVEQMGDPAVVGKQLDKAHRPKTEWSILSLCALLIVLGGALQYFLSGVNSSSANVFSHFLLYAPIGIAVFAITYFFDYTLLGRYSKLAYFLLLAITVVGFFWLNTRYGTHIHVYYSVLLFIPAFAGIIYGFKSKGYLGIIFSGLYYGGAAIMCILAPSLCALLIFTVSCLIILTVSIMKGYFGVDKKAGLAIVYVPTLLAFVIFILGLILTSSYRLTRMISMVNPWHDPSGSGWQFLTIKRLFSSSKPIGKAVLDGPLASMRIEQLLPDWTTNFSLTYIIARFGYLAGMAIVTVMAILIIRMFASVLKQKNAYGFLVSFSACLAITAQITLYVLSNMGIIAPLAVTLPFISFGAFGFITNMALLGLLLSVHRRTGLVNDRLQVVQNNTRLFTVADGKLIIDLGFKAADNLERNK